MRRLHSFFDHLTHGRTIETQAFAGEGSRLFIARDQTGILNAAQLSRVVRNSSVASILGIRLPARRYDVSVP
jgi:hypothetical protein